MSYYADLDTSCLAASGPAVRAIGWLEQGKPYSVGDVDTRFVAALCAHLNDAGRWLPFAFMGVHFCDLGTCKRGAAGAQFLIVPSANAVFVAPDLVAHYIEAHRYAPPAEFVDAVLACPEQSSDAYIELMLPFASLWRLDEPGVHRVATFARSIREQQAAAKAKS